MGFTELRPRRCKRSRLWGCWGVGRSKERDGATVTETGSGKPALRQALRARGSDLDLIRELPSGPAACEPHQRPHTCQHPTARCTNPEDFLAPQGRPHMSQTFRSVGELCEKAGWPSFWLYAWVLWRSKPYLWLSIGRFGRAQFPRKSSTEKFATGPGYVHLRSSSAFRKFSILDQARLSIRQVAS